MKDFKAVQLSMLATVPDKAVVEMGNYEEAGQLLHFKFNLMSLRDSVECLQKSYSGILAQSENVSSFISKMIIATQKYSTKRETYDE